MEEEYKGKEEEDYQEEEKDTKGDEMEIWCVGRREVVRGGERSGEWSAKEKLEEGINSTTLERKKVEALELFLTPFPSARGSTFPVPVCSFFFRAFLSFLPPAIFESLQSELSAKSII